MNYTFMQMNLIEVNILVAVLVTISTATEIFYVLPNNSSNISCPSHQCATFSQYILDNDTLPVVSNVEYYLLPGEHYVISTEKILLRYLQNFSLVGSCNKQLQQFPSTILISTDIVIFDSYNVTIKNVIFKMLYRNVNVTLQLVVCISCTIENVTLSGCGLLGYNLIRRSYLTNIVINNKPLNSEYQCNSYQGIMLRYGNYSYAFNDSISEIAHSKCITIIQNISVYHDSMCSTDSGIIYVHIAEYQTVDSIEVIIGNSQFKDVYLQPIIDIKDDSNTIGCKIWIINCTFESIITVDHTSIITARVSQFNTALNFFNCEFHYCSGSEGYLATVEINIVTSEVNFKNVACTNITFSKCNFSNNNDSGLLSFINAWLSYCQLYILFIGPSYISENINNSSTLELLYIAIIIISLESK